jgi:hypothetical protein
MRALVAELENETQLFDRAMAPAMLKEVHYSSHNMARSRDVTGRAMRSR